MKPSIILSHFLAVQAMGADKSEPVNYGMVLFPGFQALDVFGPLDALNNLAWQKPMNLALIAPTLKPYSTAQILPANNPHNSNFSQGIVTTHTYARPPRDLDVLIVPGGAGTYDPENIEPTIQFVKRFAPRVKYLLTVCTGSAVAGRAGVLDGKNATTNKRSFDRITPNIPNVNWIRQARWVVDGNTWTSSGISAGIDMTLAFIGDKYGEDIADTLASNMEYVRNRNSSHDPFA
ncbi:hypothetical protein AJ80_06508 [Polytolypa hystricis UAMH7299]|uniref:DJ-1/PfpI domain-containing protein n=1 Tax=Polytolypa hystricis (strain UAMH7299) TaxID=1447883 RepID=A0A2B7XMM1_POLH7|nr:hypothetical protein AJ80_06508 [Polytolypa hystricis UAMH7299]